MKDIKRGISGSVDNGEKDKEKRKKLTLNKQKRGKHGKR